MEKVTRLNLACGRMYLPKSEGWVNIDNKSMYGGLMAVDMEADVFELDWAVNSVDEILVSHFMPYVHLNDALKLFKRWFYWLKQDGILRIENGDVKSVATLILTSDDPAVINGSNGLMQLYGWETTTGHKWAWCYDTLAPLLAQAGFREIHLKRGMLHARPERDICVTAKK